MDVFENEQEKSNSTNNENRGKEIQNNTSFDNNDGRLIINDYTMAVLVQKNIEEEHPSFLSSNVSAVHA